MTLTSVVVVCCRLCVEELRNAADVDRLTDDVTDTVTSNMLLGDDDHSLSAGVDGDVVGDEVPFKGSEDSDEMARVDVNNGASVHAPNSDSALTDNSISTSVKTEDSTSNDCIAAEKDTDTCNASVVKDQSESINDDNDDEPMVLALNLTKNTSSNGKVSPQNVASKTFVIVENNDSGDDSLDAPIDLSRGPKSSPPVMVNGSEIETSGMVNGLCYYDDGIVKVADTSAVRKYREELRNEETKLVLLKKIRHSQAVHRLVNDSIAKHSSSSSSSSVIMSQSLSGPPPLVRGGFQSSSMTSHRTSVHQSTADMPRLHMQVGASAAHTQSVHHSAHGPPPLLMAPRQSIVTNANRSTSSTSLTTHGQTSAHGYRPTPSSQPPVPEQTAAQRQAAAKLALRRQLEKTLLQIPPPKPPPPEMNFIPNINMNAEFVMLVGLEEAVKCIVDGDSQTNTDGVSASADVKYVLSPFECVQCQTDFTPVWKRDRPGSKSVICERCVTTNQKRALKQEHTNRLKGAFVRALQQEQEIEQSLLAGVTSGPSTPPPAQSLTTSSQLSSSSRTSAGGASVKPGTENSRHYQGMSSYLSAPNLRSTPGTTVAVPGMTLPSAAAAFTASRLMFPYQQGMVPSTTSRSSSSMDLPRQFLLDMIPRRAPVDGQVLWRT